MKLGKLQEQILMMSGAFTLHNLLFSVLSLCLIAQTQTFSSAHCPIYAGMFLFRQGRS